MRYGLYAGLILYSVQKKDGNGDFLAFGLQHGYPELKFDMGSKPFTIRGEEPLKLDQWHTVRLLRINGTIGMYRILCVTRISRRPLALEFYRIHLFFQA